MANISTTYMGIPVKSPVIAASSSLTSSVKNIKAIAENGAGAVVLKSIFEEEIVLEMEKKMRNMVSENHIYPEITEFYDNYDTEDTLSEYLKLITECKAVVDIPIIASVNCLSPYDWTYFAKSLQDAGADALELNVFAAPSPDEKWNEYETNYLEILKAIKKEVSIPVSLKIGKYFTNIIKTIKDLSENGADGIVLFNRFFSPDIDIDKMALISTNVYSAPSEYVLPLRWIALSSEHVDTDLSATTGIHDGNTLVKMLLAGAQTVQLATILYKKGFGVLNEINEELNNWMDKNGYDSIDKFRGKLSQKNLSNPAGYLRFQFMKHINQPNL